MKKNAILLILVVLFATGCATHQNSKVLYRSEAKKADKEALLRLPDAQLVAVHKECYVEGGKCDLNKASKAHLYHLERDRIPYDKHLALVDAVYIANLTEKRKRDGLYLAIHELPVDRSARLIRFMIETLFD